MSIGFIFSGEIYADRTVLFILILGEREVHSTI